MNFNMIKLKRIDIPFCVDKILIKIGNALNPPTHSDLKEMENIFFETLSKYKLKINFVITLFLDL
jgi:hypothetical protein